MIECEWIQGQVEAAIAAPTATADDVLNVVSNVTVGTDEPARLDDAMREKLVRIAQLHGGKVPLHGRLFAQWLHYAFPHECAFPQKAGSAVTSTPGQYGDHSIATDSEMKEHAAQSSLDTFNASMDKEELEWMSQWSPEEELIADYSELETPWLTGPMAALGGMVSFLVLGVGLLQK